MAFAIPTHIDNLIGFLRRFGEGAFVVLSLIGVARRYNFWSTSDVRAGYYADYPRFNMLWLPSIAGNEPLEIFRLVKKLNEIMLAKDYKADCLPYFHFYGKSAKDLQLKDPVNCHPKWFAECLKWCFRVEVASLTDSIWKRVDVQLLTREMGMWWKCMSKHLSATERDWWTGLDETTRTYLMLRACDIVFLGEDVADRTWPHPTIAGATRAQVGDIVNYLVGWLRGIAKESFNEVVAPVGTVYSDKLVPLPAHLAPRVLNSSEFEELKGLCQRELSQNDTMTAMVKVVEEFVEFCTLLSKPENHIKTPTGQYIEKEVPGRAYKDMADEMVQQLVKLPLYTGQAKLIKLEDGVQQSVLRKIETLKPPEPLAEDVIRERNRVIWDNTRTLYVTRAQIKEEILQRQEKWRGRAVGEAPLPDRIALPSASGVPGGMEVDDTARTHE